MTKMESGGQKTPPLIFGKDFPSPLSKKGNYLKFKGKRGQEKDRKKANFRVKRRGSLLRIFKSKNPDSSVKGVLASGKRKKKKK